MSDHAFNTSALRRADTTKGPPLRILSLDGGGVRGYSMLILLQELMHRTYVEIHGTAPRPQETPKPCDHFDLIAGTGTGALIAIMLGRLRLDLETCKDVYVRMTRRVFVTDKTFAGIPLKGTLFKASKLEEAIRDCVREHTVFDNEGNDTLSLAQDISSSSEPLSPDSIRRPDSYGPQRSVSSASRASVGMTPVSTRGPGGGRWGNPNALLYDVRENRTKVAITAVYKGTPPNGSSVLLRSYDSRKEPAPEFNCTIWQAGRATCATGLAFKPIQVGQSVFLDEGAGKFNPAPQILDEAVINEWPGRDVGVFVSIGTGKRPPDTGHQQSQWWEGFAGGSTLGDFAEARRRLISKIEGCEATHLLMQREYLQRRRVNPDCYHRLNVEVGVGEFGMNEWNRLADISTNTHMYLARPEVQNINYGVASKLARIHRANDRWNRALRSGSFDRPLSFDDARPHDLELPDSNSRRQSQQQNHAQRQSPPQPRYNGPAPAPAPAPAPFAVELPAEVPYQGSSSQPQSQSQPYTRTYQSSASPNDVFSVLPDSMYPAPLRPHHDISTQQQQQQQRRHSSDAPPPPPVPPKTPIQQGPVTSTLPLRGSASVRYPLPYPDADEPPPRVDMSRKPEWGGGAAERR